MTKIHPLQLAKLQSILFGLIGLCLGIIYSVGGFIIDASVSLGLFVTPETPGLSFGTILAFGALIGMPIIGLVIGAITGYIEAILFNLYTKMFGPIKVNLDK